MSLDPGHDPGGYGHVELAPHMGVCGLCASGTALRSACTPHARCAIVVLEDPLGIIERYGMIRVYVSPVSDLRCSECAERMSFRMVARV